MKKIKKEKSKGLMLEEAKALLRKEEQQKAKACQEEVNAVLVKHGYQLDAVAVVRIIPAPPQAPREDPVPDSKDNK